MTKKKPKPEESEQEVNRLIEEKENQVQALKKILKEINKKTIK